MPIDNTYPGAAVLAHVNGTMTPSVPGAGQTFTVDDDSGYPVSGSFVVKIDRGLSTEEKVRITSRSGTTFTVGARGYDGTTAVAHADQATVEATLDAVAVNIVVGHVDDDEADPHSTKLLNNARHDLEARHTFGGAYGTPATPTALTPDIAGAAGTGNNPAREDHAHNVPAATAVTSGLANAEGSSGSFARADHTHDQAALSVGNAELAASAVANNKAIAGQRLTYIQSGDPGAVGDGNIWFDTANRQIKVRNAADSGWDIFGEVIVPWTDYTPTITSLTLGSGGTNVARYTRLGDTVLATGKFVLGTGGNISGEIIISLPFQPAAGSVGLGGGQALDVSVPARWAAVALIDPADPTGGSTVQLRRFGTAGVSWQSAVPFNWTTGDMLLWFYVFQAE